METLIMAIVSMAVLALIIIFLPLGFTNKGKVIIVMSSFVLALVGVWTVSILSLWKTALILFLLTFIICYLLFKRMNQKLFIPNLESVDELNEEENIKIFVNSKNDELQEIILNEDLTGKLNNTLEKIDINNIVDEKVEITNLDHRELDLFDVEVSFLLERVQDTEQDMPLEIPVEDTGYLEDIESMLFYENETSDLLEENDLHVDGSNLEKEIMDAVKEAAAASEDDFLEKINIKKDI